MVIARRAAMGVAAATHKQGAKSVPWQRQDNVERKLEKECLGAADLLCTSPIRMALAHKGGDTIQTHARANCRSVHERIDVTVLGQHHNAARAFSGTEHFEQRTEPKGWSAVTGEGE